jgi:hypothetical protein
VCWHEQKHKHRNQNMGYMCYRRGFSYLQTPPDILQPRYASERLNTVYIYICTRQHECEQKTGKTAHIRACIEALTLSALKVKSISVPMFVLKSWHGGNCQATVR